MKKIINYFIGKGYGFREEHKNGGCQMLVYIPTNKNNLGELVVSEFEFKKANIWLDIRIVMTWMFLKSEAK